MEFNFQGLAFTFEERQALGIHGLLPPRVKTQEEQLEHCKVCLDRLDNDLNKYIYVTGLLVSIIVFSFCCLNLKCGNVSCLDFYKKMIN